MSEHFGNYELLEKIAVGGMAEIFLARSIHGRGVEKSIVIKRIHPALAAEPSFVAMFIDEARLGVSLVHGNIVPVFDFGYVDGYYFLAMEHVRGRDLAALRGRSRVVGKPWPVPLAIHVAMEVLEGLAYSHEKRDEQGRPLGLVHRDVSPSNILLSYDGQVKLLDFGIARSEAHEHETRTGVIKGKPGYMAPEQAAGKADVDARADVWSLGAVLHELLTGVRLKDGRQTVGDAPLDAILDTALASLPADRYRSARDFQSALAELLVARHQRPTASDLAPFIAEVLAANAPGQDWDMRSDGVEVHVAAALGRSEGSAWPTLDTSASTAAASPEQGTLRLKPKAVPKTQWPRRTLTLGGTLFLLVALGAAGLALRPQPQPQAVIAPPRPPLAVAPRPSAPPEPEPAAVEDAGPAEDKAPLDQPSPVAVKPKKRSGHAVAPAVLTVVTVPWSHVYLDGKRIGTTPVKPLDVPAGKHRLMLTNPVSNQTRTLLLHLAPGEARHVKESLED